MQENLKTKYYYRYTSKQIEDLATPGAEKAGLGARAGEFHFRRPALEGSIPFSSILPVYMHYV